MVILGSIVRGILAGLRRREMKHAVNARLALLQEPRNVECVLPADKQGPNHAGQIAADAEKFGDVEV